MKKGGIPGPEIFIAVVVVLVIFVALITTFTNIFNSTDDSTQATACALETILHSRAETPFTGDKLIDWNCPINGPDQITLEQLKTKPNLNLIPEGSKDQYLPGHWDNDFTLAQYNLEAYASKQAIDCWKKAGEGKERIFESQKIFDEDRDKDLDNVILGCGVCSVFYLEKEALDYFNGLAAEQSDPDKAKQIYLNEYMKNHPVNVYNMQPMHAYLGLRVENSAFPGEQIIKFTPTSIDKPMAIAFMRQPGSQFKDVIDTASKNWVSILATGVAFAVKSRLRSFLVVAAFIGGQYTQDDINEQYDESELKELLAAFDLEPSAYVEQLEDGNTMLWVAPIDDLKRHCDFIANSFDDDKLREVWV